jgi:Tfp pilus assembly protein PilW
MRWRSLRLIMGGAAAVVCASTLAPAAHAEDFLSALFGAFGVRSQARSVPLPFASEGDARVSQGGIRSRSGYSSGSQAYCVRTCDGRYFPISGSNGQSRAASCNDFCPASETKVVYGSNIDHATTESGTPYSELPNAFRYRNELVAGCTCNGKDRSGLVPVKVENDPTLRKGDLVVGADGLMVAGRVADRRGASLNFSPASEALRARVPVVVSE